MKNKNLPTLGLFRILTWWILGIVLAFPIMFLLNYFTGRISYYPGMGDMGHARIQQLRLELIILVLLNVITPIAINTIETFYTDLTRNGIKREIKQSYFRFSFNLARIKRPIPYIFAVMLIVGEQAFIIAMMIYLRQNYYRALNDSMDFLIGAPYGMIVFASILLVIDCLAIFSLLLFSFLWGHSWVRWASDKLFPNFSETKSYFQTLLMASLIFRALNMLGLTFVINFMVTFSGKFDTVVKMIFKITILLFLWIGIYIVPYLREKTVFRKNKPSVQ